VISFRNQQFFQKTIFSFLLEVSRELPQHLTLNVFFRCLFAQFNPVRSYIFVCVAFQPIDFCSVPNLPHLRQDVHSFALQWLPIFILRETRVYQTFGLYQPFPTLQTCLMKILPPPPLLLQQQLLRLNFVPMMRRNRIFGFASSKPSFQRQESNCGLHHGRGCSVVASSYCFTHGRGKANKKHGQEKIVIQRNTRWKMMF
jgi:hypothetical protein